MNLLSEISDGVKSWVGGVCSCVSRICESVGGSLGGTTLNNAISDFIKDIAIVMPEPKIDIARILDTVGKIIEAIAEALGVKDKDVDSSAELAMKAKKDTMTLDDFETTQEYIKHLHEDVELSKEEKEKLAMMSPEEKAAYTATGGYLYAKACGEKLGFETEGLKNPELLGLTAELLVMLAKNSQLIPTNDLIVYSNHLRANGLDMKDFTNFMRNCSPDLATDEKVMTALTDGMKEIKPGISQDEINHKLYEMNIEG